MPACECAANDAALAIDAGSTDDRCAERYGLTDVMAVVDVGGGSIDFSLLGPRHIRPDRCR
jgi:hypothetical protein